jgi:hypothetical protein
MIARQAPYNVIHSTSLPPTSEKALLRKTVITMCPYIGQISNKLPNDAPQGLS